MKISIKLKINNYNECILPVVTYACETGVLNKRTLDEMQVHQRSMVRRILDKTFIKGKWQWTGHVARLKKKRSVKIT